MQQGIHKQFYSGSMLPACRPSTPERAPIFRLANCSSAICRLRLSSSLNANLRSMDVVVALLLGMWEGNTPEFWRLR